MAENILVEKNKKRDLTWYVFFNYCDKTELPHYEELKALVKNSKETGNSLLLKLLEVFKKWLPTDEFVVVHRDLRAVTNDSKAFSSDDDIGKYVTGTPMWEGWTKEESKTLKRAKQYTASHFSFVVIDTLLEKNTYDLF